MPGKRWTSCVLRWPSDGVDGGREFGGRGHSGRANHTAVQSQKAVTAHFSSEELLPFGFAEYHRCQGCGHFCPERQNESERGIKHPACL